MLDPRFNKSARKARVWIKICGITSIEDADLALHAGADAIGLNLVPESPRCVSVEQALGIAQQVASRLRTVAVVADRSREELVALRRATGIDWLQLHGSEPPELVFALTPHAYKALRIANASDVASAPRYPGELLLADAKVPGLLGGSGARFDWSLVRDLAKQRPLVLAGGLNPDNVAEAITQVLPFGVDVASGVELEGQPRKKDPVKIARFVALARAAALAVGLTGCATAEVRGGEVLRSGHVPEGRALAEYRTENCRDKNGGPTVRASSVRLIREPSGREVLVELRKDYPSLMAKNSFVSGPERVFQVVVEPASGNVLLHEFHLPAMAGVPARVLTVRRWREVAKSDHDFRGYPEEVVASCSLVNVPVGR
jgi:phosphoribosylanthranilate isomerase